MPHIALPPHQTTALIDIRGILQNGLSMSVNGHCKND